MLPTHEPAASPPHDPHNQLRHDLKTPLTAISGHAQLLGRVIRRSPSLREDERVQMAESLAAIEAMVQTMVTIIDAMGREDTRDAAE
jgi:signal transduction histidine kinase